MSTLNIRRVDVDHLSFTMAGATGTTQLNWDNFYTDLRAISFVLTGAAAIDPAVELFSSAWND